MIKIIPAENGYVIIDKSDEKPSTFVVAFDSEKSEAECFRDLVYTLQDILGHHGSRHDLKRFYGVIAPGDKREEFTDKHLEVIYG